MIEEKILIVVEFLSRTGAVTMEDLKAKTGASEDFILWVLRRNGWKAVAKPSPYPGNAWDITTTVPNRNFRSGGLNEWSEQLALRRVFVA